MPTPDASQRSGDAHVRRTRLAITAAAVLGLAPLGAHGAGAHVHGEGRLDIAIEADRLEVFLTAPLGDLAGDGGRDEASLRARFADASPFEFGGATCVPASLEIEITRAGDAAADLLFADPAKDRHHDGHEDGRLSWRYRCTADPASVRVTLFETTKLEALAVQAIGPTGVRSGTLDAADRSFDLP